MQVKEILVTDIETASPDTPLLEAARQMRERDVGFLPVVEGDVLVGVVTDRDIVVRSVSEGQSAGTTTLREVMSVEVVCCFADDSVEAATALMDEHGLRRLPVVDREYRLVGFVNRNDLEGRGAPHKRAVKVTFKLEKTDSYGRPHQVPVKTVYVTGVKNGEQAKEAAIRRVEKEKGVPWTNIANSVDSTE